MAKFIQSAYQSKHGGSHVKRSLYISGPPGTGKTATLEKVLSQENPGFKAIFLNCMMVDNSKDIFKKIAEKLDPEYDGNRPEKFVEAKICSKGGKPVLLVLDEIDQLDNKGHEILYSIFEWPYIKKSRLVLIGIANSLTLTDEVLVRLKLSEKMNPQVLQFPAYSKVQIAQIINERLQTEGAENAEPIIKPMAVNFLAARMANASGDVRKALDACRRTIEVAELEFQKQTILTPSKKGESFKPIDLPQVAKTLNDLFSSKMTSSLKNSKSDLPIQQKIILATILLVTNYGERKCKEISFGRLHSVYEKICKKRNMTAANSSDVLNMCTLLEARGAVNIKKKKNARENKLSLRIDEEEIKLALQDKNLLHDITIDTGCLEI